MANKKYLAFAEQADGLVALKGKDADWYLCPICGFVHEGSSPDVCPICKAKGSVFVKDPVCLTDSCNSYAQTRRPPQRRGRPPHFIGMPQAKSKFLEAGYIQHLPVLGVDLLEDLAQHPIRILEGNLARSHPAMPAAAVL